MLSGSDHAGEYDDFLSEITAALVERVEKLGDDSPSAAGVFLDPEKVILAWPELSGLVIEELRAWE